ncbi:MAG: hypothetical protein KDB00_01990 [Planctomycetales bacterium]|nr:hypothetical protein [Planctomycetales bacterium]
MATPLLQSIPGAIKPGERFDQPDWDVIADWVSRNSDHDKADRIWTELAVQWIDSLITQLPGGYSRFESTEFLLLANCDPRRAKRLLDCCEYSRRTILELLDGVARDVGFGKHVVFAFPDIDTYYDYISDFYPEEGEFGLSAGIFLNRGYGHFAICMAYGNENDRIIAHELNHALVRHLPLPLWLNEGVTQVIEDSVVGSSHFFVNAEIVRRHRDYWDRDSIHYFWSGESFQFADDGQELSYHLAQVLFRNLMSDYRRKVNDFLNTANYLDSGNGALIQTCGVSLADRVTQFLGDGPWAPRSNYQYFETNPATIE